MDSEPVMHYLDKFGVAKSRKQRLEFHYKERNKTVDTSFFFFLVETGAPVSFCRNRC